MRACLPHLALVFACAVVATPGFAQSTTLPAANVGAQAGANKSVSTPAAGLRVGATGRITGLALAQSAGGRPLSVVSAAGSLILLADGIVAGADMAQIAPPAPGFVYER